jgi:trehalose 6-phosphate phosphatase
VRAGRDAPRSEEEDRRPAGGHLTASDALRARLREAPHRLLAFDFDGTLAPYAPDPREARALPEALDLLARLAASRGTTVAVVSGRPIPNLDRVVPIGTLHLVGEHGWEERAPGQAPRHHPLPKEASEGLERILDVVVREGSPAKVERKRTGVAIHTRALDPEDRAAALAHFESVYRRVAEGAGLRLDVLDGGAEAHALGHDKGSAVRSLLATLPAGAVPIYVGDDITDEPAFEAVVERGLGFKVGRLPDGAPASVTAALHRLESPAQVAELMARILRLLEEDAA